MELKEGVCSNPMGEKEGAVQKVHVSLKHAVNLVGRTLFAQIDYNVGFIELKAREVGNHGC